MSAPSAPAPDLGATSFDPAGHTVTEVQAYVEANPAALDAVYAAEQAGRARVTLLDWLAGLEATA